MHTLVTKIISLRKTSKGGWYQDIGELDGIEFRVKGFGKWLQIFTLDGIDHGMSSELRTVKEFKEHIESAVEYAEQKLR